MSLVVAPGCIVEPSSTALLLLCLCVSTFLFIGHSRQRRARLEAEQLRRAIASGHHRSIEQRLQRELSLALAGEAISIERQWLTRAQLGGLLVAQWRLREAAEVYALPSPKLSPHLEALAAYGHHELFVLANKPDLQRLQAIRRDRNACLRLVPATYRHTVARAWAALEGLCLSRMGDARRGISHLQAGLDSLGYNPARVVYLYHLAQAHESLGALDEALRYYEQAAEAFPGTRLASDAAARHLQLSNQTGGGMFRRMLPEIPHSTVR